LRFSQSQRRGRGLQGGRLLLTSLYVQRDKGGVTFSGLWD